MAGRGHGSVPYSTASRQASFGPDSIPCCFRLWSVLKHASHAEQECALSRRCWKANGRSSGGRERERLEDLEDCEDCENQGSSVTPRSPLHTRDTYSVIVGAEVRVVIGFSFERGRGGG